MYLPTIVLESCHGQIQVMAIRDMLAAATVDTFDLVTVAKGIAIEVFQEERTRTSGKGSGEINSTNNLFLCTR